MADIPLRDTVPLEANQLESDLTYEEKPVKIIEFASRVTHSKVIKFCKVQWSHHTEFWNIWEKWHTSWSYPKDYQEFMMCFTFPT